MIINIDIKGYKIKKAYFYIVQNMKYDLILEIQQIRKEEVIFNPINKILIFLDGIEINNKSINNQKYYYNSAYKILAAGLAAIKRQQRKQSRAKIEIFAASIADINKALTLKKKTDP